MGNRAPRACKTISMSIPVPDTFVDPAAAQAVFPPHPAPECTTAPGGSPATLNVVHRLVHRTTHLYSLPSVAAKVLELTNDPQVGAAALKACIENDPALTTKILRVVNSSLFGLRREVSDLNQALAFLGTKPLKLLVLGFSLPAGLFAGVGSATLGWYWRHTLTKAVAARDLCETVWRRPGDECFLVGLLQDLGTLLLIQELGAAYLDFLEKVRQRGYDLFALEAASMGFDHTVLSSALLRHWGLPEALVEAVLWLPAEANAEPAGPSDAAPPQDGLPPFDPGRVVHLAEWIARLLADGQAVSLKPLLAIGQREHGLAPGQLEALVGALEEKVRSLADVLSLELLQTEGYRELLAEAHARLSDVAAAAAAEMLNWEQASTGSPCEPAPLPAEMWRLGDATARLLPAGPAKPPREDRPATTEVRWSLLQQLTDSVALCRRLRCPLSLLLIELGRADEVVLRHGLSEFHQIRSAVETTCRTLDHERAICIPYGEAGFAVVLPDCDRQWAVRLGNQVLDGFARSSVTASATTPAAPGIGVGAATVSLPPKNFPAKDLLVAASRCLFGSHASGRGVVKSIEIY